MIETIEKFPAHMFAAVAIPAFESKESADAREAQRQIQVKHTEQAWRRYYLELPVSMVKIVGECWSAIDGAALSHLTSSATLGVISGRCVKKRASLRNMVHHLSSERTRGWHLSVQPLSLIVCIVCPY